MSRAKWPAEGNSDFSIGQSRLANTLGTLARTLNGGVEAIKQDASAKTETANDDAVRYMLSSESNSTTGTAGEDVGTGAGGVDASKAAAIITEAYKFVPKSDGGTSSKNVPYHWGAQGPGKCPKNANGGTSRTPEGGWVHECCFDCSGFASYVYRKAVDIKIGPPARSMCASSKGRDILTNPSAKDLKSDKILPGDLVFFKKSGKAVHHVAICLGDGSGKMIEAPSTGSHVKVSSILSRSDTYKVRRYLPESAYVSTGGVAVSSGGVDTLNGYTLPVKRGFSGNEEPVDSAGRVPSTGQKITFHKFAKLGKEYRDYYITMRWNYVKWKWDGHATDADEKQISWMNKKPRIVLVTNTRTGDQIYAVAMESGPAPWTGTAGGKTDSKQKGLWGGARRGNPAGYTGRSCGFPPVARKALNVKQQVHGKGGDVLTFQWAKDQNVKPGPCKVDNKPSTSTTSTQSGHTNAGMR